jgi:hypothetical protein
MYNTKKPKDTENQSIYQQQADQQKRIMHSGCWNVQELAEKDIKYHLNLQNIILIWLC